MTIRECRVIVVEGTHGSGKTTLVHALAAELKREGVHIGVVQEVARRSPFVEEVAVHRLRNYDIHADLHLFATHIAEEQRAGRQYDLVLVDRSIISVLAYAEVFGSAITLEDQRLIAVMRDFTRAYVSLYDAVLFLDDVYDMATTADKFRPTDRLVQQRAHDALRRATSELYPNVIYVPTGLSLPERTEFVMERIRGGDRDG